MQRKTDRRIKYTKTVLRDSLITLLQNKPIEKISVKELCELADVNRSTFYAHYADPYDLLKQIELDMINDLSVYLSDIDEPGVEPESLEQLISIFEYIIENAEICKVLLGEHGETEFIKDIFMVVQRRMLKAWGEKTKVDAETLESLLIFTVYGCIGLIRQWLKDGLNKSAEEMSELITSFIYRGLSAYGQS